MDEKQIKELLDNIRILKRLLAHQVAQGHETLRAKAVALRTAGIGPNEIADICGTTSGTIRVQLAQANRKPKKKG